ncbi:MAG: TIGR03792 family protein [Acidimicrobiaceae bacterium]|nr:TIGR03792 family protein [Acidimicrobiaceae bacterium]MXZ96996.1 TIGR03792 family protein [Acidimicrobiaceae bacterium]MYF44057.1 TIGR03792 family protein [Acidimicrobiaceae bacterium]MYJ36442.1 TIGR03792 family protein [Acidimicrobiaceae bacterium]
MVIEFLTFEVAPDELEEWLTVEEQHWSRYLEGRPGFIGKEMWVEEGDPGRVHAVIRWESMEAWDAVPPADVEAVDEAMGRWCREATMRAYRVIRDC